MTAVDSQSTAQGPRFYRGTASLPINFGSVPPSPVSHPGYVGEPEERGDSGSHYEEVWRLLGVVVPGAVIVKPLRVRLIWEPKHVLADAETVNLHALGDDRMGALVALGERLASHLRYLQQNERRLSPSMREELDHLNSVLLLTNAEPDL